jgi:hypothetical protein
VENWSSEGSETRLRTAYDNEGFVGWLAAAAHELELEAEVIKLEKNNGSDTTL